MGPEEVTGKPSRLVQEVRPSSMDFDNNAVARFGIELASVRGIEVQTAIAALGTGKIALETVMWASLIVLVRISV